MRPKIVVRVLPESEFGAWSNIVARSPEGSIYSTPEYLDVLASVTNGRFKILVADREGEIAGGIGLFEQSSRWGISASPRYLLYYHGIVTQPSASKYPSERTSRQLETLGALEDALSGMNYGRLEIKSRSPLKDIRIFAEHGWRTSPSYSYVVSIGDLASAWSRTEQNLRRLIARCEREGMICTEDDDFDSFYRLHEQTHARKGSPIYLPEPAFREYYRRLHPSGLARFFQVRLPDRRVISTQMVLLGSHPVTHTVTAAADPEFLKTGATALLRWKVFERLSELGYQANDLTDAALNPVTHFKSQFGGDLKMSTVLARPESARFRFRNSVYRAGDALKRVLRGGR
jgi:hypothetical protein